MKGGGHVTVPLLPLAAEAIRRLALMYVRFPLSLRNVEDLT